MDIGRLLQNTQFLRQAADYDAMPVSQEQAAQAVVAAEKFVSTAAALVAEPYRRPSAL